MVAMKFAVPPLAREIGLPGDSVHVALGNALASQVALIFPV
jgi:hypothetical protein